MHAQPVPALKRRFHQLDGLRAVAVLLVLVHHSASSTIRDSLALHGLRVVGELFFRTTASGVELFFVLSGVVLLRPYLRGDRRLDAAVYARRRLERIAPPYLGAWLLAGAVTAFTTAWPTWFSAHHLARFSWRGWLSQAFVLRFTDVLYNDAWWSLAVEVLFYVVAPLVVLVWSVRHLRTWHGLAALAAAAAGATALVAAVSVRHLPLAMLYSLGAYASCFCGGVLVARFDLSRRTTAALVGAGLAWIVVALWLPWLNFHVGYGLLYTGVVQRLIAAEGRRSLLASDLAVWLGERSYSLFLVHVSVFQLVDHVAALVMPNRSPAFLAVTRLVGLPAAFLAAMALFTLVERRFARGLVTAGSFWPPLARAPAPAAAANGPAPRGTPSRTG